MNTQFRITARFLQPYSHGRGEDGSPEWPPSPLRLFQALVASAVGRQPDTERRKRAIETLRWLERQPTPEIVAPAATIGEGYLLYVPNNVGDKVAQSWSAGREPSINLRTDKDVRPIRMAGEAVSYVFRGVEGLGEHLPNLERMARSLTHLGWGVDMVVGEASCDIEGLVGERWIPNRRGGTVLRLPVAGTLEDLDRKHGQFLARLADGTFNPVAPLTAFASLPYARSTDAVPKPYAAFLLLDGSSGERMWLDPGRHARDVAAWTRHAVSEACERWPFGPAKTLVHGHQGEGTARLSFVPLPTINHALARVEAIARVLVAAPPAYESHIGWLSARLAGQDLLWKGRVVGFLDPLAPSDWVLRQYVDASTRWSTVTPVILPGHDDRSASKAGRLLRRAFLQAGIETDVVENIRELAWRKVGFRAGTDLASRYLAPDKVTGPMFHVRVRFRTPIRGPLAVGSGRYRGVGVFARE